MTYAADVCPFVEVDDSDDSDGRCWDDLADLLGVGAVADLFSSPASPPPSWRPVFVQPGVQMTLTDSGLTSATSSLVEAELVELTGDDLPEMLQMTTIARPGPFGPRTRHLGTYLGIRRHGELVAMAGERLHPSGWTEISAVCTAPHARGRGYAARLVSELADRITVRGDRPFLHALADNGAVRLYRSLGFGLRISPAVPPSSPAPPPGSVPPSPVTSPRTVTI